VFNKNPLISMTIGLIITFALILLMAGNLYIDKSETKRSLVALEQVESLRVQLNAIDRDLTALLRMQLANPSQKNYQSYQQMVESLQGVMKKAQKFARQHQAMPVYEQMQALQNGIISMQNRMFLFIEEGQTHEVEKILLSPSYHAMEMQYAAAMVQLIHTNSSYQYWLTLCNNAMLYQNYQTNVMVLLNGHNLSSIQKTYLDYHARLSELFFEAIHTADPLISIQPFQKANQDYQQIHQINEKIFLDIQGNLTAQAQSIVLSDEYQNLSQDYNVQINLAISEIKMLMDGNIQSATYTNDLIAIALIMIILMAMGIWIYIIRLFQEWKKKLIQANAILDKKVEVRTKKLIDEIRAHKEAEKQKKKLESVLHQHQKLHAVGVLAAGIAHDFNNLLAIILANAQSLDLEKKINQEAQQSLIEAARDAGHLTQQLLMFSRKSPQVQSDNNLNDLVLQTIHLLEHSLPKNILLEHQFSDKDLRVLVDANQVKQVLLNIAINAKDAMPQGGRLVFHSFIQDTDELNVEAHQNGPWACVIITDTGTGISAEDLPFIFDPFFTKKEVNKGTGLGLATAYGIMQQHKGSIRATSDEKGTQFILLFPLKVI
jgi:signal transduction histidine kinase